MIRETFQHTGIDMSKRKKKSTVAPKRSGGLPDPFPSSPVRCGLYVFYIRRTGKPGVYCQVFAAVYAAKAWLDVLLDGEPNNDYDWVDDNRFRTDVIDIRFQGLPLQELLDYKVSDEEAAWELPEDKVREAYRLRHGRAPARKAPKVDDTPTPATEPKKKEKKKSTPRASREGLTSVGDIAAELNMAPREARGILRKKKVDKPDVGWAWPKNEVKAIKDIIKKG